MPHMTCPQCGRKFDAQRSPALPFCSQRCRWLDLHGWLNEEYGLPYEREEDSNEGPAAGRSEDER